MIITKLKNLKNDVKRDGPTLDTMLIIWHGPGHTLGKYCLLG